MPSSNLHTWVIEVHLNLVAFLEDLYRSKQQKSEAGVPHKGLNPPKRFTNLSGWMLLILNYMGLMHQYGSLGVPQTPKSCNAQIEVFKFIRYICVKISCMFAPILLWDLRYVNLFVEVSRVCSIAACQCARWPTQIWQASTSWSKFGLAGPGWAGLGPRANPM